MVGHEERDLEESQGWGGGRCRGWSRTAGNEGLVNKSGRSRGMAVNFASGQGPTTRAVVPFCYLVAEFLKIGDCLWI